MQIITNKRKHTCLYKIIHFSVQFSAIVNRFIVKTYLNSTFTNDLKRNKKNRKRFIVADLVSLINLHMTKDSIFGGQSEVCIDCFTAPSYELSSFTYEVSATV